MSAASSGGVLSSVDLIASMIWETGSSSARRTSSDEMTTVFGRPGQHVAPAHLRLHLLRQPVARADLELDLLGRLLADEELVLLLDVGDDRVVHLVAADAQRLRDDDAAERDHRDLGRAAADVDDHVPGRLADRQAGADRGGHRLLDQVGLAGTGGERRVLDGALLDARHPRGDADDHARVSKAMLVHLLDEVPQHLLGDVEVGDDAVLEGADRRDRARRAPEHPLRLDADGVDVARALVDRDHGRLREHDATAAHVDEGVGGAEVDRHVAAAEAGESVEPAHGRRSLAWNGIWPDLQQFGRSSGEHVEEERGGQPDDVEVVAVDRGDETGADALDRVAAGAAAPLARSPGRRRSRRR